MGLYNIDAVSGSTNYSKGGNYIPSVDCTIVCALVDLKFVEKMGQAQSPGYVATVETVESDSPKVVIGRKYEVIINLKGSQYDMLEGIKKLASFVGAVAGVEPNTPFKATQYLDDEGKGEWMKLANAGKLKDAGLLFTIAQRMVPVKSKPGSFFPRQTYLPFTPE